MRRWCYSLTWFVTIVLCVKCALSQMWSALNVVCVCVKHSLYQNLLVSNAFLSALASINQMWFATKWCENILINYGGCRMSVVDSFYCGSFILLTSPFLCRRHGWHLVHRGSHNDALLTFLPALHGSKSKAAAVHFDTHGDMDVHNRIFPNRPSLLQVHKAASLGTWMLVSVSYRSQMICLDHNDH